MRLQLVYPIANLRGKRVTSSLSDFRHEANRLKRTTIDNDEARTQRLCEALTAPFGAASFAAPETVTNADPTPVLIVGMPRSGTTLIEQVICSHPRVQAPASSKTSTPYSKHTRW